VDVKGYYRWDLKTESPEQVLLVIENAIADVGYRIHRKPGRAKWAPMLPESDFAAEVAGRKIVARHRPKPLMFGLILVAASVGLFFPSIPGKVSGIDIFMMIVGVIFCVLGILLVVSSPKLFRLSLVGRVRRDSLEPGDEGSAQVLIAEIIGGRQAIWRGPVDERFRENRVPREQRILKENFRELQHRLESIMTSFT